MCYSVNIIVFVLEREEKGKCENDNFIQCGLERLVGVEHLFVYHYAIQFKF